MKFGFVGSYGSIAEVVDLGVAAERHGWDGFFTWDGISLSLPEGFWSGALSEHEVWDPWVVLAAVAARTERITLGAEVFALPRRTPWEFARQSLSVDHLSGGRLVVPVGLGVTDDAAVSRVRGGPASPRERAEVLDESLGFLEQAWSGERFSHDGGRFGIDDVVFRPRPVRGSRIPVWVIGGWRSQRSMSRAARWDGALLQRSINTDGDGPLRPDEVAEAVAWLTERRAQLAAEGEVLPEPFDVVVEAELPADRAAAAEVAAAFEAAGATWLIEAHWEPTATAEFQLERITAGPPSR